ncbi:MAG: shikimate dehydrogenase [Hyphomicrobiales bacterium]|nr:shikimate dehydrogenase [Hyphomicrobiales bacterium]MBV8824098.1 shikimate dehydrogenase [Hyphomicrobiales bacterium]MBV9426842.1 shikimate dehydrogenase [Bradyrhizobiaceae bacterium]
MTATNAGSRIVDGATRLYCIIGDPVAQTGSPRVFSERFRAAGRNAILVPFHVPDAAFEPTLRGIMALANLDGIIATVPYKARILQFADRILPTAQKVGAANALRREPDGQWTGDMFDGRGMVRAITATAGAVAGRNVMLIGAGGAGSAIACALADAGVGSITICEVDARKARMLAARLGVIAPSCALRIGPATTDGINLLVNASPVGMSPQDGLPAPLGELPPNVVVADVVLADETPLLRHARACGCATVRGREMMMSQVDEMLAFFGMASA